MANNLEAATQGVSNSHRW